jgi:hypothetical protein
MLSCLNGDVVLKWSLCKCYKPVDVVYRSVATFNNLVSSAISLLPLSDNSPNICLIVIFSNLGAERVHY